MDIDSIDQSDELRKGIDLRLGLSPSVVVLPVAHQTLHRRELHTLRAIGNRFRFRPVCRAKAASKITDRLLRNMDTEWTNGSIAGTARRGCGDGVPVGGLAGLGMK